MPPDPCDHTDKDRESMRVPVRGLLHRRARKVSVHFFRRPEARAALALVLLFAGCNVYDQALIDNAIGQAGSGEETGGTSAQGGNGGSLGGGGSNTGGVSGSVTGGTAGQGGTSGRGGSAGEGGEGDTGSGGTDAGRGGSGGTGNESTGGNSGSGAGGSPTGGSGNGGSPMAGAGSGGTVNGGAGTGGAGSGGAGAGGAGAGGAGAGAGAGGAGAGGTGEVCTGCARLSVPLATTADRAHFVIGLPGPIDFSAATIALRVARYAGTGGHFKAYIQEGSPNYLQQVSTETPIASIGTAMQTINWDVATAGTGADKTIISRVGIEIIGTGSTSWTNPTVIYVDSVTIAGTTLAMASFTFDTSSTVSTTPTSSGPNNVMWLNNYSADTNVTAALSWLGP